MHESFTMKRIRKFWSELSDMPRPIAWSFVVQLFLGCVMPFVLSYLTKHLHVRLSYYVLTLALFWLSSMFACEFYRRWRMARWRLEAMEVAFQDIAQNRFQASFHEWLDRNYPGQRDGTRVQPDHLRWKQ